MNLKPLIGSQFIQSPVQSVINRLRKMVAATLLAASVDRHFVGYVVELLVEVTHGLQSWVIVVVATKKIVKTKKNVQSWIYIGICIIITATKLIQIPLSSKVNLGKIY
jgi:hypothetical protein